MSSYTHDSGYRSRRTVVFFAIVGIHGLMIWAFATGLVGNVVKEITQDVEVSLLNSKEEEVKPPPPPKAEIDNKPPPVQIPPPIVNIAMPTDAPPIKVVTDKPAPPPPPRPVVITRSKVIEFRRPPDIERYYPDLARKQEQTGSPVIHWCVNADGKRDGEPEVKTSSGFDLLDQAAIKLVRESTYTPAMGSDKKPMHDCRDIKITFKLTNTN